jgi:Flp pilus assembly protein TadG
VTLLAPGPWRDVAQDISGATAVEFALVFPILLVILFSIIKFGIAFNNYLELTDSVRVGARQLAIDRSSSTPYTDSRNAVFSSAANLTQAKITVTLSVSNTVCGSDSTCATALSAAQGAASKVSATYPCDLTIMGVNFAPGCTLTSTTTERVE